MMLNRLAHGCLASVCLSVALVANPAPAQTLPPEGAPVDDGVGLIERGLRSILDGIFTEMEPAIGDMGRAITELRPLAEDLMGLIDEVGNYEAPVILDNGDILIRRKPDPPAPLKEGEVEL